MMDLWATKDTYEREEDEAERLVRPAPKVKPPRDDKKRETVHERDPDIDDDPDLKKDPDLSLNYKNIGGSMRQRIALRFAKEFATEKALEKYLRDHETADPKKHWVKDEESDAKGDKPEIDYEQAGAAIREGLKGKGQTQREIEFDSFVKLHEKLNDLDKPVARLAPHLKVPEGIDTVGDLIKAWRSTPGKAKPKKEAPVKEPEKPKAEEPKAEEPKAEEPKAPKAPKKPKTEAPVGKKEPGWEDVDSKGNLPGEKGYEPPKKPKEAPKDHEKDLQDFAKEEGLHPGEPAKKEPAKKEPAKKENVVQRFLEETGASSPDFKAFTDTLPTADTDAEGNPVFVNKAEGSLVTFDKLPSDAQVRIVQQFEQHKKQKAVSDSLAKLTEDADVRKTLRELQSPGSGLRKQLKDLVDSGTPLDELPIGKTIPSLKGKELPPGVVSVKDLVDVLKAHPVKVPDEPEQAKKPEKPKPITAPNPPRDKVSKEEQTRIENEVSRTFPPRQALAIYRLHPRDQQAVLEAYKKFQQAKPEDLKAFSEKVQALYQTDPTQIGPPAKVEKAGKEVAFEDLPEADQHQAWQTHRNKVLALSFAAPEILMQGHVKAGVPGGLARHLAIGTIKGGHNPKELYDSVMAEAPAKDPIRDKDVAKTFDTLEDENERKAAVAYFKAQDYHALRKKFLDPSSSDAINEFQTPYEIKSKLQAAMDEARRLSSRYPKTDDGIDVAADFRRRVYHRLRVMDPEKAERLESWVDREDDRDYDKAFAAWEKEKKKIDAENKRLLKGGPYRTPAVMKPDPPEPAIPPGYADRHRKPGSRGATNDLDDLLGNVKLARVPVSICKPGQSMSPTPLKRLAVYWGVEPYADTPEYQAWQQAHARDLGDNDYDLLIKEARQWLKSPILSAAVEGIVPDTQYRAALDLAIRQAGEGRYSVGLHPAVYNRLLARLAGESERSTLLTVREAALDSVYARSSGEKPMLASARIRQYASKFASTQPEIAFDLIDLATKVADDEQAKEQAQAEQKQAGEMPPQFKENAEKKKEEAEAKKDDQGQKQASYQALRSAVIRTAAANPAARTALQPVLQIIKQLG
jgi:hypothetical protein